MSGPFEGRQSRYILLFFLLLALYACYLLIQPYLEPIMLAVIIGLLAHPMNQGLQKRFGDRGAIAAVCSCLLLTFVLLLPATGLLVAILHQGITYSGEIRAWVEGGGVDTLINHQWVVTLKQHVLEILPADTLAPEKLKQQVLAAASGMGTRFLGISTAMLGSFTNLLVNFSLMLFALFFVLKDHDRMVAQFRHILPLSRSQEDRLLSEIVSVSKSALLGSGLTALTQGVVGGFAMWLAGFPGLFWGTIMAFASLIPVVGTALIWLPAGIYLFLTGETGWAIFLLAWGAIVVGGIDNFVRPLFMQGSSAMSTVVVFFSLLGGLHLFGLMGLLYGPLIFSMTLVLFHLYEQEFQEFLEQQDQS